MNIPDTMTQKEYAEHRGVSKAYISKLKSQGRLNLTADGLVNVATTDSYLNSVTDNSRSYQTAKGNSSLSNRPENYRQGMPESISTMGITPDMLVKGRIQKLATDVALGQTKLKERRGELVARAEVQSVAFNIARTLRDSLLAIPDRISPLLAPENDPDIIHQTLRRELVNALDEMTEAVQAHATSSVG